MRDNMLIIDADAHVSEPLNKLRASMKEEFQHRPISEGEGWDRTLGGRLGKHNDDPQTQLADMDVEGIDIQVLYPSSGLSLGHLKEAPLAVERARTYNDWLAEFCSANPDRLKGAALVALQDVKAAIKEA